MYLPSAESNATTPSAITPLMPLVLNVSKTEPIVSFPVTLIVLIALPSLS